jgi:hypothetical protein
LRIWRTTPSPGSSPAAGKGGGKNTLLIVGLGGAAAAGVAVALGGGASASAPSGLGTILQQALSGLTPGVNQFFDVKVPTTGTLGVSVDGARPATTSTSRRPPE